MLRYTLTMRLLLHANTSEVQLGKAAANCLATFGLWQGSSASCSCLFRGRCCMLG